MRRDETIRDETRDWAQRSRASDDALDWEQRSRASDDALDLSPTLVFSVLFCSVLSAQIQLIKETRRDETRRDETRRDDNPSHCTDGLCHLPNYFLFYFVSTHAIGPDDFLGILSCLSYRIYLT